MGKRAFILILIVIGFVLGGLIFRFISPRQELSDLQNDSLVIRESFEIGIVEEDIKTLGHLSFDRLSEIKVAIRDAAEKYQVPIGLLHAIIRVESEYQFWVNHPSIVVKGAKTNAIGLGGIVWEYWSSYLIEQKIAEKRSDLYLPKVNIMATAAILRNIIDKNPNFLHEGNLIQNLIKGYYGMYDVNYHNKMIKITSDLWLRRIVNEIINKSKSK